MFWAGTFFFLSKNVHFLVIEHALNALSESFHACAKYHPGICYPLIHAALSKKKKKKSDSCPHMLKYTFSHGEAQFMIYLLTDFLKKTLLLFSIPLSFFSDRERQNSSVNLKKKKENRHWRHFYFILDKDVKRLNEPETWNVVLFVFFVSKSNLYRFKIHSLWVNTTYNYCRRFKWRSTECSELLC